MKLELYQRVALTVDQPAIGLKKGDVATLVDYAPHPSGGEAGCVLKVFNALGDSIAVVTVKESHVEPLQQDEVLAMRHLVKA
ncbi:MAG: DUF4926 domain-containing protein [Nitrospinae bacterium]|nr:DUF4926 domain-containing protein [Nitrospinota bacterium]